MSLIAFLGAPGEKVSMKKKGQDGRWRTFTTTLVELRRDYLALRDAYLLGSNSNGKQLTLNDFDTWWVDHYKPQT